MSNHGEKSPNHDGDNIIETGSKRSVEKEHIENEAKIPKTSDEEVPNEDSKQEISAGDNQKHENEVMLSHSSDANKIIVDLEQNMENSKDCVDGESLSDSDSDSNNDYDRNGNGDHMHNGSSEEEYEDVSSVSDVASEGDRQDADYELEESNSNDNYGLGMSSDSDESDEDANLDCVRQESFIVMDSDSSTSNSEEQNIPECGENSGSDSDEGTVKGSDSSESSGDNETVKDDSSTSQRSQEEQGDLHINTTLESLNQNTNELNEHNTIIEHNTISECSSLDHYEGIPKSTTLQPLPEGYDNPIERRRDEVNRVLLNREKLPEKTRPSTYRQSWNIGEGVSMRENMIRMEESSVKKVEESKMASYRVNAIKSKLEQKYKDGDSKEEYSEAMSDLRMYGGDLGAGESRNAAILGEKFTSCRDNEEVDKETMHQ